MAHITMSYFSASLMREISIDVLLPIDSIDLMNRTYSETGSFKTLYLLHGIFGHRQDWLHQTNLVRYLKDHQLAVVLPSGENSMYANYEEQGVDYGEFIAKELVEITRKAFPLSDKREDTFIAGLSMGGLGALKNGLDYRETFAVIGSFSGAIPSQSSLKKKEFPGSLMGVNYQRLAQHYGQQFDLYQKVLDGTSRPHLFLTCGSEDFLIESNREFHQFLNEHEIDHVYHERPGVHDWIYWDQAIVDFLNDLKANDFL